MTETELPRTANGPSISPADPERQALIERWVERHGIDAARRLAEAEDLADAVAAEVTPDNTFDTYAKSWRVWTRFCATTGLPEREASRGALVAFVTWMLREGQQNGSGYAPSSASTHLAAAVVGLRERGVSVSGDDQGAARKALDGLAVKLLQEGERRGRGKAAGANVEGLHVIAQSCPDTLAGERYKALVLTGFHYASRSQDPAGLLAADVTAHPRGLVVAVLTGKTKHSVRDAKIRYANDPAICPVRAYRSYRARLAAEADPRWSWPDAPAFVGIDQWGHITGGMGPDSVTRAIKRISQRAGVPLAWTGHSLRIGLASTAR
ncbi:integrase [Streptomyces telluris]|uniref:Integrase n=1 Tax=Streptomyces telluris TaxID=2720021 RepID=A0A9X2RQ30_9ACTN|nr:integrase [Streptomyces telluris]MCQ8772066.1 integrase [Streptomyces telluris]